MSIGARSMPCPFQQHQDLDITYSTNIPYASDYFFRIPDGARPWIAALDRDGRGLVQTSTARQVGRKLFAWGTQPGGRRWQEFLSTPGHAYLEIQAGLSRTQLECSPMPAGAQWEWTEAYGLMEADPGKVHGADWKAAVSDVAGTIAAKLAAANVGSPVATIRRIWPIARRHGFYTAAPDGALWNGIVARNSVSRRSVRRGLSV